MLRKQENGASRLRILYVGTLPPQPGGCAVVGAKLMSGLAGRGHLVHALSPITPELRHQESVQANGFGITRYSVPYLQTNADMPFAAEYRRWNREKINDKLPRLIERHRPDLIVTGRESFAWYVPPVARAYSLPNVLMMHGHPSRDILAGRFPEDLSRRLLEHYSQTDQLITVAHHWARSLREFGLDAVPVPNPVDLDQFSPGEADSELTRALGLSDEHVVVLLAANLKTVKRPLDLVGAAELAVPEDRRLRFLIVGEGMCRQQMEEEIRSRSLHFYFRFVPWVRHEQMPAFIRLADMVVVPSELEMQALVYLETQACGRVLIASDLPSSREVVADGNSGLLFPKGDIESLAGRILQVARDPDLRRRIGGRARRQVASHSVDRAVSRYLTIFRRVVDERR